MMTTTIATTTPTSNTNTNTNTTTNTSTNTSTTTRNRDNNIDDRNNRNNKINDDGHHDYDDGGDVQVKFGFRHNKCQLFYHVLLSILIGVTLRITTFKEAMMVATTSSSSSLTTGSSFYTQRTAFLISFGFSKALSNLAVGRISDLYGRKLPHSIGWISGIILGCILLYISSSNTTTTTTSTTTTPTSSNSSSSSNSIIISSSWTWYVIANIFLGIQQGWTWTTNIFMYIDILGPNNRALASGLSNSIGYLSSAVTTYIVVMMIDTQTTFGTLLVLSILGLIVSIWFVRDTIEFVTKEEKDDEEEDDEDDDDEEDDIIDLELVSDWEDELLELS